MTDSRPMVAVFVSHRIDLDAQTVPNPVFHNMRCGAALDSRENPPLPGDDTGDNISAKRLTFNELTVQYWAWKNFEADFYGLCHYRRYLSFAPEPLPATEQNQVVEPRVSAAAIARHRLADFAVVAGEISANDALTVEPYPTRVHDIHPPARSEADVWLRHPKAMMRKSDLQAARAAVGQLFPQYARALDETLEADTRRGFNCFTLSREHFFQMCEFQFGVLFDLEPVLRPREREGAQRRVLGYLSEILNSTYMRWMEAQGLKVADKQIVFFQDAAKPPAAPDGG